jgi:hypothetical protein
MRFKTRCLSTQLAWIVATSRQTAASLSSFIHFDSSLDALLTRLQTQCELYLSLPFSRVPCKRLRANKAIGASKISINRDKNKSSFKVQSTSYSAQKQLEQN